MRYVSSLSGGVSSAIATDLAINKFGRDKVDVWFADTLWEHDDLYRFNNDLIKRWGGKIHTYTDGRNPLQVCEDKKIIPNSLIAPCTFILKIKPFTDYLYKSVRPLSVIMGFNWDEMHRIESRSRYTRKAGKLKKPTGYHTKISGVYEVYPLLWNPIIFRPFDYVKDVMGVDIPQLYKDGFSHNNCGGACVKAGVGNFLKLKLIYPERFNDVMQWENKQRATLPSASNRSILKKVRDGVSTPYTMAELEKRTDIKDTPTEQYDMFNCFCGV